MFFVVSAKVQRIKMMVTFRWNVTLHFDAGHLIQTEIVFRDHAEEPADPLAIDGDSESWNFLTIQDAQIEL